MENSIAFYSFSALDIKGVPVQMSTFKNCTILVVNTASKCGFTPQYEGLEALYRKYKSQGFVVLGFPCNQFGNQEQGNEKSIQDGCLLNYGVTFPMFAKVQVNGSNTHPIYGYLKQQLPSFLGNRIKWNFTKFLISPGGIPLKRYASFVRPEKIEKDIVRILG